jgi:hypothetical protein
MTLLISLLNMLETICEYLKALREFNHTVPSAPTRYRHCLSADITSEFPANLMISLQCVSQLIRLTASPVM